MTRKQLCFDSAKGDVVADLAWIQKIGVALVATSLCVALSGCAVDIASSKSDKSEASNQLRYYGGPKSPMWSSQ
jgi:hypothetical protein